MWTILQLYLQYKAWKIEYLNTEKLKKSKGNAFKRTVASAWKATL